MIISKKLITILERQEETADIQDKYKIIIDKRTNSEIADNLASVLHTVFTRNPYFLRPQIQAIVVLLLKGLDENLSSPDRRLVILNEFYNFRVDKASTFPRIQEIIKDVLYKEVERLKLELRDPLLVYLNQHGQAPELLTGEQKYVLYGFDRDKYIFVKYDNDDNVVAVYDSRKKEVYAQSHGYLNSAKSYNSLQKFATRQEFQDFLKIKYSIFSKPLIFKYLVLNAATINLAIILSTLFPAGAFLFPILGAGFGIGYIQREANALSAKVKFYLDYFDKYFEK